PDRDRGLEVARVAAEPRVGVAIGRAGLARSRAAEVGTGTGAVLHVVLEDLRDRVGNPRADRALALGLAPAGVGVLLAAAEDNLADRHRLRVDPAGSERRVGRSQIER